MAKSTTKTDEKSATVTEPQESSVDQTANVEPAMDQAAASSASPVASAPVQPSQTIKIEESDVDACYANFCRVSSTPEELIMDLGLNPNPYAQGEVTVPIEQRVIMNHYTAKRLLSALSMALQRHEQSFGVLETDVRRRIRST